VTPFEFFVITPLPSPKKRKQSPCIDFFLEHCNIWHFMKDYENIVGKNNLFRGFQKENAKCFPKNTIFLFWNLHSNSKKNVSKTKKTRLVYLVHGCKNNFSGG